jgi:hypothetical protein
MGDSTIMSGAEVIAQLKDEQEWNQKVIEMDRLCRLHLDVPYEDCAVKGHYLLVKIQPSPKKLPLKTLSGLIMSTEEPANQIHSGLVLGMGKYAFVDGPSTKWVRGPLCNLGDYIIFYTPEFIPTSINGYQVGFLRDPMVLSTTTKPHLFGNNIVPKSTLNGKSNKVIYKREDLKSIGVECIDKNVLFREDFEEEYVGEEDAR